jgi:hypothetical protein
MRDVREKLKVYFLLFSQKVLTKLKKSATMKKKGRKEDVTMTMNIYSCNLNVIFVRASEDIWA